MLVRLIYPENSNDILKQIPEFQNGDTAKIGNIIFTAKPVDKADLAVVINYSTKNIKMNAKELWVFHQNPGDYRQYGHWQKDTKALLKILKERKVRPFGDASKDMIFIKT